MERASSHRLSDWPPDHNHPAPAPTTFISHFPPPTTQPPIQFPFSDPFQANRDPFLTGSHRSRDGTDTPSRPWSSLQVAHSIMPNGHPPHASPPQPSHPLPPPPPPPANGVASMSLPYDPSRRRSLGPSSSPQGMLEAPPPPPFQPRHMPPPSPPPIPTNASSLPGSAPRGPPIASPFAGARDLASYSSNRPSGGMSISSILGGNDEKKGHASPLESTPKSMPPPSPTRARASSMREGYARDSGDASPGRNTFRYPKSASTVLGHDRTVSEPRREGLYASPHFPREQLHSFRAFQPSAHDARSGSNGHEPPERPNSQPTQPGAIRGIDEIARHDVPADSRLGAFRPFGEPQPSSIQPNPLQRPDIPPYQNGHEPAPRPGERGGFSSPREEPPHLGPMRFQGAPFATPMREEQLGLFRPGFPPASEPPRESTETRPFPDARREILSRSSPPSSDLASYDRARNGFGDRSMTMEDHHRMEIMQRALQRKESEGSMHRALLNVSPEINRRGRNSPLPQAVQGAQPRHVGPGGDNPSVKMEFGRMFSGLGTGAGTATPTAGYGNGTVTPSRMTPVRHVEGGDPERTAVAEMEEDRRIPKSELRGERKNGRRVREEDEKINGRETPQHSRGSKRAKTNHSSHHHHHMHPHHHHHHHPTVENSMPNPFNTIRFPSNPPPQSNLASPAHHLHHHHNNTSTPAHAASHHHHHPPRAIPPPRKPTTTVISKKILDDCAKKPRKHLGSQLYASELSLPPATDALFNAKIKFSSKMTPIPVFTGKENCTFTVRVPRWYLAFSDDGEGNNYLEEICKRRQLWGTEVYTDDSDVVAAAVHSGWLRGDFGAWNRDLRLLDDESKENEEREDKDQDDELSPSIFGLATRPPKPVRVPRGLDVHITVLILPPLERYAASVRHHVWSREWEGGHDGMSFTIERIEFVDEGWASRGLERGGRARKQRIAAEERKRREAAAGLVDLFGSGVGGVEKIVKAAG